jgi:hypothetical protein
MLTVLRISATTKSCIETFLGANTLLFKIIDNLFKAINLMPVFDHLRGEGCRLITKFKYGNYTHKEYYTSKYDKLHCYKLKDEKMEGIPPS